MKVIKRPKGITIEIGIDEKKWPSISIHRQKLGRLRAKTPDSDDYYKPDIMKTAYWFGIKLDLMVGTLKRPIPRFFAKEFRSNDHMIKEPATNPWNSGNHWCVLNIPIVMFFFSIGFRKNDSLAPGGYIGCKTYEVNQMSNQIIDYTKGDPEVKAEYKYDKDGNPIYAWARKEEMGNIYLALSAALRSKFLIT